MNTNQQPEPALTASDPIHEAVISHIVPGFAKAFPSSIPETIGVLADLRERLDGADRGCTSGT